MILLKEQSNIDVYVEVANQVRYEMVDKYGEDELNGKCIEATDLIIRLLKQRGINAHYVEGWVQYDDASSCTDRDYDEHNWAETEDHYIIDVTATQFNYYMDDPYDEVIITTELPHGFFYEEPENNL